LPPQIRKVEVLDHKVGKKVARYQLTVDAGINAETGRRQQVRRRYTTEREARNALAEITGAAVRGTFVPRRAITVREVCENYVVARHKLRATSKAKLEYDLQPLIERHGDEPVQRLTKAHVDELVADLLAGGTTTGKGRTRRPWRWSWSTHNARASLPAMSPSTSTRSRSATAVLIRTQRPRCRRCSSR
jgi:Arm DNA-binding domain